MNDVTCKKEAVIETLKRNRENHLELVIEAREGYVKRASAELEKRLEKLRSGKIVAVHVALAAPVDYTEEYDNAIAMLEADINDTVVLSPEDFRQFMRDKWNWMRSFTTSNSHYSSKTAELVQGE